jgi:hypothetical protein
MGKSQTLALDIGVAAALAVALLLVFLVDRVSTPSDTGPTLDVKITEPQTPTQIKPLRLGVTDVSGQWDNMADLLRKMGREKDDAPLPPVDPETNSFKSIAGFKTTRLSNADLLVKNLKDFDVLFLACSVVSPKDEPDVRDTGPRLRQFVEEGGTLYASDWRLAYVAAAFPDYFDNSAYLPGRQGTITARVLDPGLREALGRPQVQMTFDLNDWKPAAFKRDKVTVYMTGTYTPMKGPAEVPDAPLLVKFSPPKKPGAKTEPGTVIFTTFHNATQGDVGPKLLRYLVFHTVTAKVEAEERAKIVEKGFEPTSSSLVSASAQEPSVTRKYESKKRGKLMFNLAFNPQEGVKLRLRVKGPDGKVGEGERGTSFTLEVPDAQVGEWEYTVTAVGLRDPNFPFTVTVAEEK